MIAASVILCVRNESESISDIINDILNQDLNEQFELIIVDDFSKDNTLIIAKDFAEKNTKVSVIDLKQLLPIDRYLFPNKKEGICRAAKAAKGIYLITTDADCHNGSSWLSTMINCAKSEDASMVCGPVAIPSGNGLLHLFQEMDLVAMMAMTKWSLKENLPMLNNGANLLYQKGAFLSLNPYENNFSEHSGDDVFLLQKFTEGKQKIVYCNHASAIVETKAQKNFIDFFHQRVRWAGKSQSYTNRKVQLFLALVYLFNLFVFTTMIFAVINPKFIILALSLFAIKVLIDYLILKPEIDFFRKRRLLPILPIMDFLHMMYVVFFGLFSFKKSYIWKDRTINRQL
jgi:poly-beta-1,6-N-acetyl-D-glucosamine synthase